MDTIQDRILFGFSSFSPTSIPTDVPGSAAVGIKALACRYAGSAQILGNLSCSVPETGITALVGVSGSGKTTLLRVLVGKKEIDRGTIDVSEALVGAGNLAIVEQQIIMVPGTWRDNVIFGRE